MTKHCILVVEDDQDNAESFVQAFRASGHEAMFIGSCGKCLLTLPRSFHPDKLLINTSVQEGLIDKIKERFPVPGVAITGGSSVPKTLADWPVVEKPIEPSAVLAELERVGG